SPPVADLVCRMVMPNYIPKAFGISPFLLDYYILSFGIKRNINFDSIILCSLPSNYICRLLYSHVLFILNFYLKHSPYF
ncbi:MAG: hypothetical protein SGJ10_12740, partial [Bacteroidota bacterium]|nr:hypothetical protein [Bacteroidota bacterium]